MTGGTYDNQETIELFNLERYAPILQTVMSAGPIILSQESVVLVRCMWKRVAEKNQFVLRVCVHACVRVRTHMLVCAHVGRSDDIIVCVLHYSAPYIWRHCLSVIQSSPVWLGGLTKDSCVFPSPALEVQAWHLRFLLEWWRSEPRTSWLHLKNFNDQVLSPNSEFLLNVKHVLKMTIITSHRGLSMNQALDVIDMLKYHFARSKFLCSGLQNLF